MKSVLIAYATNVVANAIRSVGHSGAAGRFSELAGYSGMGNQLAT